MKSLFFFFFFFDFRKKYGEGTDFDPDYGKLAIPALCAPHCNTGELNETTSGIEMIYVPIGKLWLMME